MAMIYMQLFYFEQSYLENERELLCCAALFVASKIMYQRSRIESYCILYYKLKHSQIKGPQPPIQEAEKKEFQDRLFAMECNLLRVVDFKLDFEIHLP